MTRCQSSGNNCFGIIFLYVKTSAVILFITGILKIFSAFGQSKILNQQDPVLGVPFYLLMFSSGSLELVVALYCYYNRCSLSGKLASLLWLSILFFIYRLGLFSSHWENHCPCLGNLSDMLHISPKTSNTILKYILGYLLAGSCISLLAIWRSSKIREFIKIQKI